MLVFDPLDDDIVMPPVSSEPGHGGAITSGEAAPEELFIDPNAIDQGCGYMVKRQQGFIGIVYP